MSDLIKQIQSIKNIAVFKDFTWRDSVVDGDGRPVDFKKINVIYGRNYSGKTSLSRIFRSLETGVISDKYENPQYSLHLTSGDSVTQNAMGSHDLNVRVFNEDFVRENLQFISNPDDTIEPFAILGDDNNKIEKEITVLEERLGVQGEEAVTGLYQKLADAEVGYKSASEEYNNSKESLDQKLKTKAIDKKVGIKYQSDRFGDQNYDIRKIKADIAEVGSSEYIPLESGDVAELDKTINERKLDAIPVFTKPILASETLINNAEKLVTKSISEANKIEDLVKSAILNKWVNEGRSLHRGVREDCAFCGNTLTQERWSELEAHFDEESKKLEEGIDSLVEEIHKERQKVLSALQIDESLFYGKFQEDIERLKKNLSESLDGYSSHLDDIEKIVGDRKADILTSLTFKLDSYSSQSLEDCWTQYEELREKSNGYTSQLSKEQDKAKKALRLNEVFVFLSHIDYEEELKTIDGLKDAMDDAGQAKDKVCSLITELKDEIKAKKMELNDEEKGASKVNEYLNDFFGHRFLSLRAIQEVDGENQSKKIKFEVVRDGHKAYHLSEGESSLLAFCYFLAKLDDVDTKGAKPIIWIDDPISSLDGNHIFFIYSLIKSVVVDSGDFEQLFLSTHNLDFLKYLKRLNGKFTDENNKEHSYEKAYFVVLRKDKESKITMMPKYLKEFVTEFNFLFQQIHECAQIEEVNDTNFTSFYNFGNNARKFFEILLYYKYPDQGMSETTLKQFFGDADIPAILTYRINNEYSHLCGVFERGSTPLEVPEMHTSAKQIINRIKEDAAQYNALLNSIGVEEV